jgi:hypothetical protein
MTVQERTDGKGISETRIDESLWDISEEEA